MMNNQNARPASAPHDEAKTLRAALLNPALWREIIAKLPVGETKAECRDIFRHVVANLSDSEALSDFGVSLYCVTDQERSVEIDGLLIFDTRDSTLIPIKISNCCVTINTSKTVFLAHDGAVMVLARALVAEIVDIFFGDDAS